MSSRVPRILPASAAAACLLLAMLPPAGVAGTTGKLSGRVLDQKKQPLAGVNVSVPAARAGAVTDDQGRYVIVNLPSGTYEVKANLLGYRAVTVQDVRVSADNTTELEDIEVVEAPVAMQEVVVSAKRPVVDLKLTSNMATLHREEIQKLPVQELQDVVNLQAGVVDGHVRGGRIGEVQYQVDGVTINNPFDNKSTLRLDRSLIEEVQVVSGTFDAEYGQAMSGVVNAVLRRGGDKVSWDAEAFTGGFVYPVDNRRELESEFHPDGVQNYQLSVSGPTAVPKTTYLLNARRYVFDDFAPDTQRFLPWRRRTAAHKIVAPDGGGYRGSLGYTHEWSGVVKLSNRSIPRLEVSYQAIGDLLNGRKSADGNWAYRLNPNGLKRQTTISLVHGFDLTHTLSKSTFYTVSVRQNVFDYRDLVYDELYDPRYDLAGVPTGDPTYRLGAYVMGVDIDRFKQWTNTPVVKASFTSQLSHDQQIKFGGEYQWPHLEFGAPGYLTHTTSIYTGRDTLARNLPPAPNTPSPVTSHWRPDVAAAFAQDELEWNDLRLRAGLRFEYFSARAGVPSDLANPANAIEAVPRSHLVIASRKMTLAPRLGVSYPVTKKSALFFAYGHFYQLPELGDIFKSADYSILSGLARGGITYGVMGNPDIKPERTVQYQLGFKQAITEDFGIDLTLFYKDIRDLLGVEFVSTYNDAEYARLSNADFGNVIGATASITRRSGPLLSTALDYTWQVAQGNSSDPRETATRAQAGEDPRPRSVPFNWDQRHTLVLTVTAARSDAFSISAIVRAATGQPYSPASERILGATADPNSGRKPNVFNVDLRGERNLRFLGLPINAFARVFNVLDARFNNGLVFDTTGSPDYSRDPVGNAFTLTDPTHFYSPRRIEIGFSARGAE